MTPSQREELIKELVLIYDMNATPSNVRKFPYTYCKKTRRRFGAIADFILEDRKRIVEPLVKVIDSDWGDTFNAVKVLSNAIEKTLKLSGVEE